MNNRFNDEEINGYKISNENLDEIKYIKEILIHKSITNYDSEIGIDAAIARVGDNISLYKKLLGMFTLDIMHFIADLQDLYRMENLSEIFFKVHSLKGAAGNLGLISIYKILNKIEIELEGNNIVHILGLFQLLEAEIINLKLIQSTINNKNK